MTHLKRTYIPTAVKLLHHLCVYMSHHRDRIVEVIGDENADAFDLVVSSCIALTDILIPFLEVSDGVV